MFRNTIQLILLFLFSVLTCCEKDDEPVAERAARLRIVNAVEGSADQDLYIDDARISSNTIAYQKPTSYISVREGNHKLEFKATNSAGSGQATSLDFINGKSYTLFFASANSLFIEDDLSAPVSGKAKVRFVHLSPGAPPSLDIKVSGSSSLLASLAYKNYSAYFPVDVAANFNVYPAGSAQVAFSITKAAIEAGKTYTIYISGNASNVLSYQVIINN